MFGFKINGLHIVNGKIEPMHEVLHDPTGSEAQADRAFIARPDASKPFVYYEQKDNAWFLARLSEGTEPTLWFYQLNFGEEYVIPMIMEKSKVEALLNDEQQAEIKAKLILAAEQYNTIAENTQKQHTTEASTLPMAEETYTGKLSVADRAILAAILSNSAIEKPAMPEDYEGCQEDWDNDWDQALACALSTNLSNFDKKMPKHTHHEIISTLKGILAYLNPVYIDGFRFDRPADEDFTPIPMIGHVYDDIQQYFYHMLKDKSRLPAENLTKLSPDFYKILVGKLNDENAIVYTGLDSAQHALVMALVNNFYTYEEHLNTPGNYFRGFNDHCYSIETLKRIRGILSDEIKTEADENIFADFYAIASANSPHLTLETFAERLDSYKSAVGKRLEQYIELLQEIQEQFPTKENPIEWLARKGNATVASYILSQTEDRVLELCNMQGFVTVYRLKYIFQALPQPQNSEKLRLKLINDGLKGLIKNDKDLYALIDFFPEDSWPELLKTLGHEFIVSTIIKKDNDLAPKGMSLNGASWEFSHKFIHSLNIAFGEKIFKELVDNKECLMHILNDVSITSYPMLFKLMGQHIDRLIDHNDVFQGYLVFLREQSREAFLVQLGADRLKKFVPSIYALSETCHNLDSKSWPCIFSMLGVEHVSGMPFSEIGLKRFFRIISDTTRNVDLNNVSAFIGADYIRALIKDIPSLICALDCDNRAFRKILIQIIGQEHLSCIVHSPDALESLLTQLPELLRGDVVQDLGDLKFVSTDAPPVINNYVIPETVPCLPPTIISIGSTAAPHSDARSHTHEYAGIVSIGSVAALGVGLALTFSPTSTLGSLTLTSGVIIGLALAAAFINMAVYALAVHMMTPQTQSTSHVSLVSYNASTPVQVDLGTNPLILKMI